MLCKGNLILLASLELVTNQYMNTLYMLLSSTGVTVRCCQQQWPCMAYSQDSLCLVLSLTLHKVWLKGLGDARCPWSHLEISWVTAAT